MKIKILQENLQTSLNYLQKAIPNRPSLPILSSILMTIEEGRCTLAATDLYFGVKSTVDAQITENGTMVVPGKELREVIQSLPPGEITLSHQDGQLKISSAQTNSILQCQTNDDFPQFPELKGEKSSLSMKILSVIADRVVKSVSSDQTRPILTGVLFDYASQSLRVVGTDGFRLSIADFPSVGGNEMSLVIPGKVIDEVRRIAVQQKLESVPFAVDQESKQVLFSFQGVELFARLIDGEYPPYQRIVPSSFTTSLHIGSKELEDQVKRAQIFAKNSSNIIQIVYEADSGVRIKAESPSIGAFEGEVDTAKVEGEPGAIAFNARYILDYLQQIEEDEISIQISGQLKPALFSAGSQKNYSYVVMPFRVNS